MKQTWGGPRSNAGRKKILDKKKQVYLFLRQSEIDYLGGLESVQKIMGEAIKAKMLEAHESKLDVLPAILG